MAWTQNSDCEEKEEDVSRRRKSELMAESKKD
jgi:hypothetical protein